MDLREEKCNNLLVILLMKLRTEELRTEDN